MQNPQDEYTKKLYELEVAKANAAVKYGKDAARIAKKVAGMVAVFVFGVALMGVIGQTSQLLMWLFFAGMVAGMVAICKS